MCLWVYLCVSENGQRKVVVPSIFPKYILENKIIHIWKQSLDNMTRPSPSRYRISKPFVFSFYKNIFTYVLKNIRTTVCKSLKWKNEVHKNIKTDFYDSA